MKYQHTLCYAHLQWADAVILFSLGFSLFTEFRPAQERVHHLIQEFQRHSQVLLQRR